MKIETKFSIGDTVWFMKDNKPRSFTVNSINVNIYDTPTGCNYGVERIKSVRYSDFGEHQTQFESDCFATKEELIASL